MASTTPLVAPAAEKSEVSEFEIVRDALKDEYELIKELGRGGMAIVFQAREKHLERDVAIKVLPFSLAFDKEFVERFQREARTSARLEHPYIIPIYRVGKSGRAIYFVMKFLRGTSLSDMVERRGPLPPEEIKSFLKQTASALGYAHKNGIVHRDIKPDNIMFDEMGHAVVTDFGIAKAATGTKLTGTGMSIGTPHYMSPEQARAQQLDGRSDVYSLGVVAYQCLTGHVPFDGEDAFSIGYKHIMEELPTPQLRTAEQRALFEIVKRMMAKSPDDRYQSAEDLVSALEGKPVRLSNYEPERTASDLPTAIMPSPAMGSIAIPPEGRPSTPTTPIPKAAVRAARAAKAKEKKRSPVLVGMLLFVILGGGGAGGYWYFVMDAQWPPQFGPRAVTTPPAPTPGPLVIDSGPRVPPGDSTVRGTDSVFGGPVIIGPVVDLPTTGVLLLSGRPPQARVSVNGEARTGDTITVAPGSHRIEVRVPGYKPYSTTAVAGRGDTVPVVIAGLEREDPPPATCNNPEAATYNARDFCFDAAPVANAACIIPRPENVSEELRPVQLWLEVKSDGSIGNRRFAGEQPRHPRVVTAIFRLASSLAYQPATKNGRPVDGWLKLNCRWR